MTTNDVWGIQAALDNRLKPSDPRLQAGANTSPSPSAGLNPLPYTATQSSTYKGVPAATYANLTDGAFNTGTGTGNDTIAWVKADLGAIKTISEIWIGGGTLNGWGIISPYINAASLEVSRDNTSWAIAILILSQITDKASTKFAFGGLIARYIRVRRNSNYIGLGELKIFG